MNATFIISAILVVGSATSSSSHFAYNTEIENGKVESKTVYTVQDNKFLQHHLKYNFKYDDQNRLSCKEVLKWNENIQVYEKSHCLNISYVAHQTCIEYVAWDAQLNSYADVKGKTVYQKNESGTTESYQSYEWNDNRNEWSLLMEHNTISWEGALLLAAK